MKQTLFFLLMTTVFVSGDGKAQSTYSMKCESGAGFYARIEAKVKNGFLEVTAGNAFDWEIVGGLGLSAEGMGYLKVLFDLDSCSFEGKLVTCEQFTTDVAQDYLDSEKKFQASHTKFEVLQAAKAMKVRLSVTKDEKKGESEFDFDQSERNYLDECSFN